MCQDKFQFARQYTYLLLTRIYPAMICVHDIIAITGLAVRVSIAFKDTPDDYNRHILKEVAALQLLVDEVAPHIKSIAISQEEYHHGEKVLKDCRSVLEDLNSFIRKYKRLASINKGLDLNSVKLCKEDITALHERLISKAVLLKSFLRRCVGAILLSQPNEY